MDNPVNENFKQLLTREQTKECLKLCDSANSTGCRACMLYEKDATCVQTLLREALRYLQNDEQSTQADINKTGGDLKT